jgi:hypothetical protein
MAQLQENIQISSFRELSLKGGNMTHTNEGLVHGSGLTWFRSAFNVQNARQCKNAQHPAAGHYA